MISHLKPSHVWINSIVLTLPLVVSSWSASEQPTGCSVSIIKSDMSGFEMEVELLDLQIDPSLQDGMVRYRISVTGEPGVGKPGLPELPHISRLIAVPPTAALNLEWSGASSRTFRNRQPLLHHY